MNATTQAAAAKARKAEAGPEIVSVVGTGSMGSQIACLCALSGFQVRLAGRSHERLKESEGTIKQLIGRKVEKGACTPEDAMQMIQAVSYHDDLAHAVRDASIVIESVAEDREIKSRVLHKIAKHASQDTIIGTNSSTIGSSTFLQYVSNPSRLLNIHFYNPPLLMALVEVVRGDHTAEPVVSAAMDFARSLGKTPVAVHSEAFGFLANRMLFSAIAESLRLVEGGFITAEECDLAVRNALGWPMGPFAISDLVGLDIVEDILEEGVRQTADRHWEPSQQLKEMVKRGELGRKTGKGFSDYQSR